MSPTVFRYKRYRYFFFSRDEEKMHIHVYCSDGEAKFWVEPEVTLARNYGLSRAQIAELKKVTEDRKDEITDAWNRHFRS